MNAEGWRLVLLLDEFDEKQQSDKGVRAIASLLKGGVTTLIEAAAKGAGEAMMEGE
jgi:hypothetical protein